MWNHDEPADEDDNDSTTKCLQQVIKSNVEARKIAMTETNYFRRVLEIDLMVTSLQKCTFFFEKAR